MDCGGYLSTDLSEDCFSYDKITGATELIKNKFKIDSAVEQFKSVGNYKYRLTMTTAQAESLPPFLELRYVQGGEYILFADDSFQVFNLFAALKNISPLLDPSDPNCKGVLKVG